MKIKFTFLLFFVLTTSINAQEFKSASDYLTFIGNETDIISRSTWKYTSAVAHSKSARKIDVTRKALVKSIQNASKKISTVKDGFKGDTDYKDQILSYLSISESLINQDYEKIIDMQEVAEQSYDYMEAYILARDLVNQKINQEVDKLNDNDSELSKKIKISNEVFENHTQMYLIFFKVNFTETNLMKAVENKDLNAIQQNANALENYSNEGLEKIKTFKAFKNDILLVNATKKVLEFTKKEALEFTPNVISFMMLNQKFDENKLTMDNKSEKSRTKEEVDDFNKLVNELNKEVGNYNKLNNKYNSDRKIAINNWNQTGDLFISKHVPAE